VSTKKTKQALQALKTAAGLPAGPLAVLAAEAMDEVEALANAARVIEAWQTGERVLTRDEVTAAFNLISSIAKESDT
jgi:hypothetical protein